MQYILMYLRAHNAIKGNNSEEWGGNVFISYFRLLAKFFICFYVPLIKSLEMQHVSAISFPAKWWVGGYAQTCHIGVVGHCQGGVAVAGRACVTYTISYISRS